MAHASIWPRLALALLLLPLGRAAAAEPEVFAYRIDHQTWGDIGMMSNKIWRDGERTTVETRVRIKVRFIIVLYHEEAERREVWRNGRLIAYEAETDLDGKIIRISGRAGDGGFRIETAGGVVTAPADVYPTNPLSPDIARADTVMGTTRGLVVPVEVESGQAETVELAEDRVVSAWRFKLSPRGDPGEMPFPQEAWFDADGIPVMFSVTKKDKRIAFIMTNYDEVLAGRAP